ncbi:response regulator transcription factor [Arthrobacter humicola]
MSDLGVAVVVEDDKDIRNLLESVFLQAGFEVHTASDGREGVELVRHQQANIVTLDVGLPDIDGYEVLRRIRQFSDAYVVMLTGRSEEPDMLTGLHSGADDYITKPFRPLELRARVAAMMRRPRYSDSQRQDALRHDAQQQAAPAGPAPQVEPGTGSGAKDVLEHRDLRLSPRTRSAELAGRELELTRSEFVLLEELLRAGGGVCTRADLVKVVRGDYYQDDTYISEADERAVEVHIGNLRKKLHEDAHTPQLLQTVRGVGYRLGAGKL